MQGLSGLRHGALPQDFPGEDEIRPCLFHYFPSLGQHERMAVNARVHVFSVAVPGGFEHYQMRMGEVDDSKGKADFFRGEPGPGSIEEGGFEGNSLDIDALLPDQLDRKDAVQTAGKKGDRPDAQNRMSRIAPWL